MKDSKEELICENCHVALCYPHQDDMLAAKGVVKCTFCGYCKVLESHKIENRIKNQK